jgi:hypothetical protein
LVVLVALRPAAPRAAAQLFVTERMERSIPALHGPGSSQRDERHQPLQMRRLFRSGKPGNIAG